MTSKRIVLTTIFLVACIASTVWFALSTVNYSEFFRAVETFNLKLKNVNLIESEENIEFSMIFEMLNPTSYRGFRLREFSYKLSFKTDNTGPLEISSDTLSYATEPIEVTPYWNQTFTHRAFSNAATSTINLLQSLYRSGNQTITWILEATVVLLNPLIEKVDIQLSSSLEVEY
jgi:hypothetical protein